MVSKSKAKGSYHERWFLKLFNSLGITTKKQPLSGSLGGEYRGDLTVDIAGKSWIVEVKYRDTSQFPNVFNLLEDKFTKLEIALHIILILKLYLLYFLFL